MPLNKQQIEDAYNSIYAAENNNVLKKYKELSTSEIVQALLVILNNNGGNGSSGGGVVGGATTTKQDEQTALLESLEAGVEEIKGNFLSTTNMLGYNIAYLSGITDKFGYLSDEPATNDIGSFSFLSLFKRLLQKFVSPPTTINTSIPDPFPVSSAASVIALNLSRKGLTIYNPLNFDIYVGFKSTVSNTSYAVKVPPEGYWEAPYHYLGIISIASDGTNVGDIQVRELV